MEFPSHELEGGLQEVPLSEEVLKTMSFQSWSEQENLRPSTYTASMPFGRRRVAGMR